MSWRNRIRARLRRRLLRWAFSAQLNLHTGYIGRTYNPDDYETLIVHTKVAKALLDDPALDTKALATFIADGYRPALEAALIRRLQGAEY